MNDRGLDYRSAAKICPPFLGISASGKIGVGVISRKHNILENRPTLCVCVCVCVYVCVCVWVWVCVKERGELEPQVHVETECVSERERDRERED